MLTASEDGPDDLTGVGDHPAVVHAGALDQQLTCDQDRRFDGVEVGGVGTRLVGVIDRGGGGLKRWTGVSGAHQAAQADDDDRDRSGDHGGAGERAEPRDGSVACHGRPRRIAAM